MPYTVTVDDMDITNKLVDEGFTVTQVEMGVRRATIKLYEQLYSLNDELKVQVNDRLIFQGVIDKESIRMGEFSAFASDILIQLADKNARTAGHYEYENQDYTDILKDLLSYYFPGVFDVTNVDDTGKTCEHINLKDKQISECAQIIAQRSQHVLWLKPPNILYFKARDTISSGHSAILGVDIKDLQVTRDTYTKTKVIIRMKWGDVVRGTGERITVLADDTITIEAEANDLADAILAELQDTQIQGEIILDDVRHDIYAGTTMVLHAPSFGFDNQTIRIRQVAFSPLSTRLTVGTIASFTEGVVISLQDRISRIEARGLRWLFTCESRTQAAAGCGTVCELDCQVSCESVATCVTACQEGACQSSCQLSEQIMCVADEQICGDSGIVQEACSDGHRCETNCQQGDCQIGCEGACLVGCETSCQAQCQTSCQIACLATCQTECEATCQTGCEAECVTGCETTCQEGCLQEQLCCGTIIY